jgi:DNA polymerase
MRADGDAVAAHVLAAPNYSAFKKRLAASGCPKCPELCANRHHIVVDRGNPEADIVVIGEAPGETEDLQGRAFVGRSGQLLDKVLDSVGLSTDRDMLIINVVKCRPPANRAPKPVEAKNCFPYLRQQLNFVKPSVVLLLGATAAKHLMPESKNQNMKDRVGQFFSAEGFPGVTFQLLYHPAYLLRDPRKKADMLEHLKALRAHLDARRHKKEALP